MCRAIDGTPLYIAEWCISAASRIVTVFTENARAHRGNRIKGKLHHSESTKEVAVSVVWFQKSTKTGENGNQR